MRLQLCFRVKKKRSDMYLVFAEKVSLYHIFWEKVQKKRFSFCVLRRS